MKKIRILIVSFDTEIQNFEVPAFRAAIIKKAGEENILFHNHLGNDGFVYRYPLIQYKTISRHPAIVCVEQGVDEIHNYFQKSDWSIEIGDRHVPMKIHRLNMNQFTMQVWDRQWDYSIRHWIALNQENYKKYNEMDALVKQALFLESILKGNILSFAKGIGWEVDKTIELSITEIKRNALVSLKGNKVSAFTLNFKCNVFLPNYIGLGKSISQGFGVVKSLKNK
jgi:hypothetical protein